MADTEFKAHLDPATMPGHYLLARLGKRVMRPGGFGLTTQLIEALQIGPTDDVAEFSPALGKTARLAWDRGPASYVGLEEDEDSARRFRKLADGPQRRVVVADFEGTGLPGSSVDVAFGEALLTLVPEGGKRRMVREVRRLLRPGGRYGIHEMTVVPADLPEDRMQAAATDLSDAIRVGARPLRVPEWVALLESEGFAVEWRAETAMRLLDPARVVDDEGLLGALRLGGNVARSTVARRRVLAMWRAFRRHSDHLGAVALVARKI